MGTIVAIGGGDLRLAETLEIDKYELNTFNFSPVSEIL